MSDTIEVNTLQGGKLTLNVKRFIGVNKVSFSKKYKGVLNIDHSWEQLEKARGKKVKRKEED